MEIKKTTVVSFLVSIAGILTEIMFRDVLAKSAFGVVLSVILAISIIVLAYFFYEGLTSLMTVEREIDKKRQEQYDQKLYEILNEQIQFEQAIYKEVHALLEKSENKDKAEKRSADDKERDKARDEARTKALEECLHRLEVLETETAQNQNAVETKEALEQIQDSIQMLFENQNQNTVENKEALEQIREDTRLLSEKQGSVEQIQEDIQTIIENESELRQSQNEMQERIRKVIEILSVLLSLLRNTKQDDEVND